MKKLRITAVLLAAGVVAASGVFAQDIEFDGYVNSGLGVVVTNGKDANGKDIDPFIAAQAVDARQNAFRIRLHAKYTSEDGNAGAALRFQSQGGNNAVSFPYAYGWVSAFDKLLTVKGGIVDDGTWMTTGYFLEDDQGEGLGALAKISPISGLDIGVGAYVADAPKSGSNYKTDLDAAKYTFNVAYTLPEVVKITATYRTKSETKGDTGIDGLSSRAILGVDLKVVPKLKAVLELELDNLQDFNTKIQEKDVWGKQLTTNGVGKINIYETVQYDLGSLSVGLWAVEWLSQVDGADLAFYVNPWVSYTLGSIVPRLDLGYGGAIESKLTTVDDKDKDKWTGQWHRKNIGPTTNYKYDSDYSLIAVRPSVKLNLNPQTFVEIGDLIHFENGPSGKLAGEDSRISNVFYVDFKWAF